MAQSAVAAEYADCISAVFPDYDCKQSDGEAPVILENREFRVPIYCHRSQVYAIPESEHLIGSYL